MPINNLGLNGQPTLPYIDFRSYAGSDIYIDLTFLDYTGTPVTPVALTYQIDDLTNAVNVIPQTNVPVTGTSQTLNIPGGQLLMTHYWQGSEVLQIWISAQLSTGSILQTVAILELVSIQTPQNSGDVPF
jgi:hypothetical protein